MGIRQLALHLIDFDRASLCHRSGVLEAGVHGFPGASQRQCEKTDPKVGLLAKIFTQASPGDEIESIRAMITSKAGSIMTIEHPAVKEKVKQANESCMET